jgi:hypothetical protein
MLAADVCYGIRSGPGKERCGGLASTSGSGAHAQSGPFLSCSGWRLTARPWRPTFSAELKRSQLEHGLSSQKCNDGMDDSDENISAARDAGPLPQADAAWAALQRFLSELFAGSFDRGRVSRRFESESGTN